MKKYNINQAIEIGIPKKNDIFLLETDTLIGISTLYKSSKKTIDKIYALKKRPLYKKMILLISNYDQLKSIAQLPSKHHKYFAQKWPRKTTFIFKLKNSSGTIAIRMPQNKKLLKLIEKVGPIYSTSYNISGEKSFRKYSNFNQEINGNMAYYIYNKNVNIIKKPSKVIALVDDEIKIIRK